MIMDYGSFAYFLYIFGAIAVLSVLMVVLRNRSPRVKKFAVLAIALINLAQHFFKSYIYAHMFGNGFTYENTAYNMCALLIISSPFVFLSRNRSWKDFICCAGTIAGVLPLFIPVWFIGKPAYGWEMFRFYFCHVLLLYSSALPLILKLHSLNWKNWFKYPMYFILYLVIILANDVIAVYLGLVGNATAQTLAETLYKLNPLWMMHPSEEFAWVADILDPITPDAFFSNGNYVPILWYAYPLCIFIAVAGLIVGAAADRKNFVKDFKSYYKSVKKIFKRNKVDDNNVNIN